MEILSFFSSRSDLVNLFDDFLNGYSTIKLSNQDRDTKYYRKIDSNKNDLYFHFLLNDIDEEFSYNYTENEQQEIKNYFGLSSLYLFDIQYRDELFLRNLLNDFQKYLKDKKEIDLDKILLSHSLKGLVPLESFKAAV